MSLLSYHLKGAHRAAPCCPVQIAGLNHPPGEVPKHDLMQPHLPCPALPHSSFASSARRELTGSTWADCTPKARWALSFTNAVTSCSSLSLLRMST